MQNDADISATQAAIDQTGEDEVKQRLDDARQMYFSADSKDPSKAQLLNVERQMLTEWANARGKAAPFRAALIQLLKNRDLIDAQSGQTDTFLYSKSNLLIHVTRFGPQHPNPR